ncbi:MAG: hypothetical protein SwStaBPW_32950 [Shewanella algae]
MAFKREQRYIVAKISDVTEALTDWEQEQLETLMQKVMSHRECVGKKLLECVVVESDWPIYSSTWAAVEQMDRAGWELGGYDNGDTGCQHCGRSRLCVCENGKHRCEKCNWSPELNGYAPTDL